MNKSSLSWIPMHVPRNQRIGPPNGLEDFQQAWFWNLFWASLEAESQGYLPMSSNLWSIAGARRKDFWESHKSRLLACFEVHEMEDGKKILFYPPLVALIREQTEKLKGKQRRTPAQFSEVLTDIHKDVGLFSSSGFDVDVGSNKTRTLSETAEFLRELCGIPNIRSNQQNIEAALKTEAAYLGVELEAAAKLIAEAVLRDRREGIEINTFYFQDTKWRNNGQPSQKRTVSSAEQRSERIKQNILNGFTASARRRAESNGSQCQK